MIKHTLAKRDDALHCPFVGPDSSTAEACGTRCAASLNLRYPVKAPYKVIEYNVKRMAVVILPPPPSGGAGAEDDSSSSNSFDEELEDKKRRKHLKIEIEMEKEMEK